MGNLPGIRLMKLKFLLQKNAWFIEHELSWYCIPDDAQISIAASALPLVVVDSQQLVAQPHLAGVARLTSESPRREAKLFRTGRDVGAVRVTLTEPDGTPVAEELVSLDSSTLSSIEWLTHPFKDGWLAASTSLVLDNVRQLELQAYLPASADSEGKSLLVHNDTTGTSNEVWLQRDKNNVIPLLTNGERGKVVLRLECDPEPVDGERDPRRLGFVLAGETLQAA